MGSDSKKPEPSPEARKLLAKLLDSGLISPLALAALPSMSQAELNHVVNRDRLLIRLVDFKLLTPYQADRVGSGKLHGLVLGKYRVLDRLGVGNAGVVFRGEHCDTAQQVAIKVLIPTRGADTEPMLRFFAERKTVAQLAHPGIVRSLDVGEAVSDSPDDPVLYYYVMEHIPGADLEQHVRKHGALDPGLACDVAYQVADALTEAHKHNLVHRDVKPANILLTPDRRALLLDFGLVRQFDSRQTEPGTLIGLLEWIAPEQLTDAHAVDIRADIYSLGCTLFWCLTAKSPYGGKGRPLGTSPESLKPPSLRGVRADLPAALDAVVARMMAPDPADRFATPQEVMVALTPFVSDEVAQAPPPPLPNGDLLAHVLIIAHDPGLADLCRAALASDGSTCDACAGAEQALQAIETAMPDIVLLDADLPGTTALEILAQLRRNPRWADLKVIVLVGGDSDFHPLLVAGADDYLAKPFDAMQLRARVKTALLLKQTPAGSGQMSAPHTPEAQPRQPEAPLPPSFWQKMRNWLPGQKKE